MAQRSNNITDPAPPPPSALGRHRPLSSRAGVRVSPLCYGAMSLGNSWSGMMSGGLEQADGEKLLDHFYEQGGNFIDTANAYQDGQSEEWIGTWMRKRKNRDEMVIATKYTTCFKDHRAGAKIASNNSGNSAKSLRLSVERSLKLLQTDYIDILYLHWWDHLSSIEEIIQSLNQLVQSGKVLYLGVSDTPAWVVAQGQMYARAHGLAEFVIYQGRWNAISRDLEREIIPMCRQFGLAIAPWQAIGAGRFRTKEMVAQREKEQGSSVRGGKPPTEQEEKLAEVLQQMGQEHFNGASIAQMAIAYVMNKTPNVYPIIGTTKIAQLQDSIGAVSINLSPEQMKQIEETAPFDLGFPHGMIHQDPHWTGAPSNPFLIHAGFLDVPRGPLPAQIPADAKFA